MWSNIIFDVHIFKDLCCALSFRHINIVVNGLDHDIAKAHGLHNSSLV